MERPSFQVRENTVNLEVYPEPVKKIFQMLRQKHLQRTRSGQCAAIRAAQKHQTLEEEVLHTETQRRVWKVAAYVQIEDKFPYVSTDSSSESNKVVPGDLEAKYIPTITQERQKYYGCKDPILYMK